MHVPKTGGTSLTSLLEDQYSLSNIIPREFFKNDWIPTADFERKLDRAKAYPLLRGHYNAHICAMVREGRFAFTLLRDPIKRVLSLYEDWSTKSDENLETALAEARDLILLAREAPLADVLASDLPMVRRHFHNGQTGQLGGWPEDRENAELFDDAVANLDMFDLVGTTERMSETLGLLCQHLGWEVPSTPPRLNVRRANKPEPDEATVRAITEYNRADIELYRTATATVSRHLDGPAPTRTVSIPKPAERSARLTMDGPIPGSGWHQREGLDSPVPWRWTGPGLEATVDLAVRGDDPFRLSIGVISVIDEEILQQTKLFVDGEPVAWEYRGPENGIRYMDAAVPARNRPIERLIIRVPRTLSHAQVQPETGDERQKGIAVTSIELKPDVEAASRSSGARGVKVYHHHIMKTGGTTINAMLKEHFGESRSLPKRYFDQERIEFERDNPDTPFDFWRDTDFHRLYSEHDYIYAHRGLQWSVPAEFFSFAIFRDPLERIASLIRDWRRHDVENLKGEKGINKLKRMAHSESLFEVATTDIPAGRVKFRNGMCKSLLNGLMSAHDLGELPEAELAWRAARRLEDLDFVGIQSRFRESALMLFDRLRISPPEEILHLNKTGSRSLRDELPESQYNELLAINAADVELLRLAEARFETQVAETDSRVFEEPSSDRFEPKGSAILQNGES